MDMESGLKLLDDLSFEKRGRHLSDLERKIFEETWQDGEYQSIDKFSEVAIAN